MNLLKFFILTACLLFGTIALAFWWKKGNSAPQVAPSTVTALPIKEVAVIEPEPEVMPPPVEIIEAKRDILPPPPSADRIKEFFNKHSPQLPIVQTITYKSKADWLKGKPAWLADYASHYKTSRHFIARSLNNKPDYTKQNVSEGDRFNILKPDKNIRFHLLVDISRCKLWFYYVDEDTHERVLIKDYIVGLGREDASRPSGCLTPIGTYTLGEKVAVYKPKVYGLYNNEKTEMVTVFGTRWIPFEDEIGECTDAAKGYGLHGVPLVLNEKSGKFEEDKVGLGDRSSDGCIRMSTQDIEELYSIIISRPTSVEIVKEFHDASFLNSRRVQ